jgi:hypothetical protein
MSGRNSGKIKYSPERLCAMAQTGTQIATGYGEGTPDSEAPTEIAVDRDRLTGQQIFECIDTMNERSEIECKSTRERHSKASKSLPRLSHQSHRAISIPGRRYKVTSWRERKISEGIVEEQSPPLKQDHEEKRNHLSRFRVCKRQILLRRPRLQIVPELLAGSNGSVMGPRRNIPGTREKVSLPHSIGYIALSTFKIVSNSPLCMACTAQTPSSFNGFPWCKSRM